VTIVGANDAPIVVADANVAMEDAFALTAGNVLTNDGDIDNGAVLRIAAPGEYVGTYGTLALAADGSYGYVLANDGLAVQSLAYGQVAIDAFDYEVTDGIAAVDSTLHIAVSGDNDAPVAANDAAIVVEDWQMAVLGNLVANDRDVDQGTVLRVVNPGASVGEYGSLELAADGTYTYTLDNAAAKVQSLGRDAAVVERFGYTASDGLANASATLDVFLHGTNDAPNVVLALADHDVTFNKPFVWQMPTDSFKDIDTGDVLTYSATQADGAALPDWLHFDAQTLTFSGTSPKTVMSLEVRVTATDKVAATGSEVDSLSASDVFTLSISHGNQGVGNGQDAAPAGQTTNFNDGVGTSPGNPGVNGGNVTSLAGTTAAPAPAVALADAPETDSAAFQQTLTVPTYLGHKEWAQYGQVAASGRENIDAASIFAHWLAMDLAMSKALAGNSSSWLDAGLGSDTTTLNKATTGFLGSTHSFGKDTFSLLAGAELKAFKGLAEGLQKIA
jgi:VCBS repeat-containing protein